MKEYKQNDVIRLPVTVQDEHGVQVVYATAECMEDSSTPENTESATDLGQDRPRAIRLEAVASDRGSEPEQVELRATVTREVPGEYAIREIQAFDMLSQTTRHALDSIVYFRIIDSPEDDREGPNVLDIGELS